MTARKSRALLAFTMLTFITAEASHGAWRARRSRMRSSVVSPRVVP
jgi:hypothetical protein